ncbi:LOW QUALITY PROTEIN: mitotic spindle assembly checkpoint protein MAD2A-like [Clytia hemisphaerica]|uniref:LOW QUALITY PROTEIN: mitotic spindle assembly checkpoint protein MAD2A-like n=1 Tax=Clytia hemisphaerica TaxID=252671 RepID=UPI0034D3C838
MAQSTAQANKSKAITLKGSAELIGEFFEYGVNCILFQRGLYPMESFDRKIAYDVPVFVSTNTDLNDYLHKFIEQMKDWLVKKTIQRIVLVITSVAKKVDVERWTFNIECDKTANETTEQTTKPVKEVRKEMQAVIKQIVSTVTFLPILDERCTFDLLVYTDADSEVPALWEDGEEHYISNAEEVKLKSFSTLLHKVDMAVCYKVS